MISPGDRRDLLAYARESIRYALSVDAPDPVDLPASLRMLECGVFVTLDLDGALKGCIGHVEPSKPLGVTLRNMSEAAAERDPRFPPLLLGELGRTTIEISLLTPPRTLDDPLSQLELGRHGVLVRKDGKTGVYLPKVAIRQNWNAEQLLAGACKKAGLAPDAWNSGEVRCFEAEVFSDDGPGPM